MNEQIEAQTENARHVVLSYKNKLYYVSQVNVSFCEDAPTQKAVFHAISVLDNSLQDLVIDIPRNVYDVLVEYAKLNDPNLILAVHVDGVDFKWSLISESWLRQYVNDANAKRYVV